MQKIKILSPHEAKKIAAGEVIERPANAVKELVENAIDAQANNITVFLQNSGKKQIRVIDDGFGMSKKDAYLCFEHHATSKINSIYDLSTLSTFGFRGEALSSIAAISNIKLTTREKNSDDGICLLLEGGEFKSETSCVSQVGTDIEVCDIFFNVPARFKFLKKDETELRQIIQIFQSFCLSYKNIHFKLFNENKLVYNCPPTDNLRTRIIQLWDHNLDSNMLEVQIDDDNTQVSIVGLISNQHLTRFNRSQIFFFVNNRWVKNQSLIKAMAKGYANVLPKDKYPVGFFFIDIPQDLIDVNVHPRKEEIQFIHPKKIENLIQASVTKSLENQLSQKINNDYTVQSKFLAASQTTFDFEQIPSFEPFDSTLFTSIESRNNLAEVVFAQNRTEVITHKIEDIKEDYKIIGQFNNCYIMLEIEDGLLIIDQHAAHERILYETFIYRFSDIAKVKLIFPIIINLTEQCIETLTPYFEFLQNYAIDIEYFSSNQLIIRSIPVHLKDLKLDDIINQLISWIQEYQYLDKVDFFKLINEKLCAQMACKAAVKSGDKLSNEQIVQLLNDLYDTKNRFSCPHGRPTSWHLNLNEIEKKFKRNYR